MAEMQKLVAQLPPGFAIEWSGLSFEEQQAGAQAPMLYAISILVVFLCLAALYESWSVPFAVMLVVPLGILGSVTAAYLFNLPNDVYLQVAFLTTVGLAAKNAILIVEFAKEQYENGEDIMVAVSNAASQRFRPILMTSFSFVAGLIPLVIATGAGAVGNRTIGASALGGTLFGTIFGVLIIPGLYYLFAKMEEGKSLIKNEDHVPLTEMYHYNDEVLSDD